MSVEEAEEVFEAGMDDPFTLDGDLLRLDYSHNPPPAAAQANLDQGPSDWVCDMCQQVNFSRYGAFMFPEAIAVLDRNGNSMDLHPTILSCLADHPFAAHIFIYFPGNGLIVSWQHCCALRPDLKPHKAASPFNP